MSKASELIEELDSLYEKVDTIKGFEPKTIEVISDRHKVWELGTVNDFLNKWVKLSAKAQKQLFGFNMIGRKSIFFDEKDNRIRTSQKVAFGQDANIFIYTVDQLLDHIKNKKEMD